MDIAPSIIEKAQLIEVLSKDLPEGWKAFQHPEKTNMIIYGNVKTNELSWEKPKIYKQIDFPREHIGWKGLGDYRMKDPRFQHHPSQNMFLLKRIEELEDERDEMKERLDKLERIVNRTGEKKKRPGNDYKVWSIKEETEMLEKMKCGISIEEIANVHNRTHGAIKSRFNQILLDYIKKVHPDIINYFINNYKDFKTNQ